MSKLNKTQRETADKIIQIGLDLGKNEVQIRTALTVAYLESSLGVNKGKNTKTSAIGLYQYTDSTWNQHVGDRTSNDEDSIRAFYKDMQRSDNDFATHKEAMKDKDTYQKRPEAMKIPYDTEREEYIYAKHHDGRSANPTRGDFTRNGNLDKGINILPANSGKPEDKETLDEAWNNSPHVKKQPTTEPVTGRAPQQSEPVSPSAQAKPATVYDERAVLEKPQEKQQASILDYVKTGVSNVMEDMGSGLSRIFMGR